MMDYSISRHPKFRYKTEFQSHEPEIDYLKILEIEDKINKIRWCQTANGALCLLSSNDKTIKLWKVNNHETSLVAKCRSIYTHAHDYDINSISNNRCNSLTEVITSAEFHPTHRNMLAYSSSRGLIHPIDMRQSALCDTHSKLFEEQEMLASQSYFTEIIASISDIKFAKDGRYILSRDYITLKLWDINMDNGPVATFQVHENLRPKLCDLYDNDSIFDKFECCLSGDGLHVATGSYSNMFHVFGCSEGSTKATTLEASKNPMRRQVQTLTMPSKSLGPLPQVLRRGADTSVVDVNGSAFDFASKLLHLSWHPTENLLACAVSNSLYMYYA